MSWETPVSLDAVDVPTLSGSAAVDAGGNAWSFDEAGNYIGQNQGSLVTTDLQGVSGAYPTSDLKDIGSNPSWLDALKSKDGVMSVTKAALAVGGLGQLKSGMDASSAQRKVGKLNASILEGEAQYQLERGQLESMSSRRKYQALLSKQKAGYGASGVSSTEGTPLMVLENTYMAQETDASLIKWSADIAATKARNSIPGVLMESELAARKSRSAGVDSLLTSGGRYWQLNG